MKNIYLLAIAFLTFLSSCKNDKQIQTEKVEEKATIASTDVIKKELTITPITHGTLVIEENDDVIYVDPYGGAEGFSKLPLATMVVITDIHGDHMNTETLKALDLRNAKLLVPQAVADKLPVLKIKETIVIKNGEQKTVDGVTIEAIPMYNLRKEALKYHEKSRGNGYVLTINGERIYISGDTEDIPEMRSLRNINKAFVCMNLPYTMTVESAASAVLDFKPKQVYPYHYRGTEGLSDVDTFKALVNQGNQEIKVVQYDWYPNKGK